MQRIAELSDDELRACADDAARRLDALRAALGSIREAEQKLAAGSEDDLDPPVGRHQDNLRVRCAWMAQGATYALWDLARERHFLRQEAESRGVRIGPPSNGASD